MSNRTFGSLGGSSRFRREIAAALVLKVILLGTLWFVLFRHDPALPKPSVAELFAPGPLSFSFQETHHAIR
jgi:hypothetical protein